MDHYQAYLNNGGSPAVSLDQLPPGAVYDGACPWSSSSSLGRSTASTRRGQLQFFASVAISLSVSARAKIRTSSMKPSNGKSLSTSAIGRRPMSAFTLGSEKS